MKQQRFVECSGTAATSLAEMWAHVTNEAFALNLIGDESSTSPGCAVLRSPNQAPRGLPPPPSDIPPPHARRLSSKSILHQPELTLCIDEDDDDVRSDCASTETDAEYALHVLERLALMTPRGSFSSNQHPSIDKISQCSRLDDISQVDNQPHTLESIDQRDSFAGTTNDSDVRRRWGDDDKDDRRARQHITRMRAQMQLVISRLQRDKADLVEIVAKTKEATARREKHVALDHAAKIAARDRQIKEMKKTILSLNTAVKNQQELEAQNEQLKTQVADLKFEMKMMHNAYAAERARYPNGCNGGVRDVV
ncbi:Aste57867_12449 [Aphanomyces stellatus]|uniref:Aste57867_12449 protein n=1 Tax=Aphanomyces stellatus TaxID=120398 RepID=A0A485KVZ4_9STRA|nr:hypothetical protein As57867_012403 [Aphanomyces stellatus]VFT89300.1 Aste57867_12449 [Aphanomyces stellatus]